MKEPNVLEALEQARCALTNLQNLGDTEALINLPNHPFFKVVKMQITNVIEALDPREAS
jgi:hypothetical protein